MSHSASVFLTRRRFLGRAAALAALPAAWPGGVGASVRPAGDGEEFWLAVQAAFEVDRAYVNLNNGGVSPTPLPVRLAMRAHQDDAGREPFYAHEGRIAPRLEAVRAGLADEMGCGAEEIALTRNTSEGMEIVQLGFELGRGDEIVTTDHDYPRMLNTWAQRAEREGVVVRKVPVPVPLSEPGELVRRLEAGMTSRTRLVMCCHMVDLTGQILPVRAIADAAHRRGVPVLVDGAQTFGHLPFRIGDLDCDFFATSLHKWLMAPPGTGLLFVRQDRIRDVWPLMPAAPGRGDDIRKFEDIGTRPASGLLAVADALAFHRRLGSRRKLDRLVELRNRALAPILAHDRVRLQTDLSRAGALATIDVDGVDPVTLRDHLWRRHGIRTRPIRHDSVRGIRVSPGLQTTLSEIDRFVDVMDDIVRHGLRTT